MNTAVVSLYEILGGKDTLSEVVDELYQRILADDRIAHYFVSTNMDRQRRHLAAFMAVALGGPNAYSGRGMSQAHAGLGLTSADFGAVAGHLVGTLEMFKVPQQYIDTVVGTVAGLESDIVGK